MTMTQSIDIKQIYEEAGQAHLFKYWDTLSEQERESFLAELSSIPNPTKYLTDAQNAIEYSATAAESRSFAPLPLDNVNTTLDAAPATLAEWYRKGLGLIHDAKVGIILMSGGQGSRLGSSAPKGAYDVGLPSKKSLFQLQCERIAKLRELTAAKFGTDPKAVQLPLYIMTSVLTREAIESFFVEHDYFGLPGDQVIFFNQGTLPALSMDGKQLLMGSKNSLLESPDGNGGLYKALYDNKIVEDMQSRGIEHVHMYCVDNILVKIADPTFLGYSALNGFDVATKVVRKTDPSEKVGLIVIDDKLKVPCVIEYSEISQKMSEMADPQNSQLLNFRAANIVNHYYSVSFLDEMIPKWISSRRYLPYHIAKKKVKCLDQKTGKIVNPNEPNGIKMEQFIFDVFPSVNLAKFGCLEVAREDEFSPLKNGPGSGNCCPETCREDLMKRSTRWLLNAGGRLDERESLVEIDPAASYDGEGLEFVKGKQYKNGDIIA